MSVVGRTLPCERFRGGKGGVGVAEGGVEGQQVYVMHGEVIALLLRLQESHVDERRSIEPVKKIGQLW